MTAALLLARPVLTLPAPAAKPSGFPTMYDPPAVFEAVEWSSSSFVGGEVSPVDAATSFIASRMAGGDVSRVAVTDVVKSESGMSHVYLATMFDGLPVVNLVSNVNVDSSGSILSAGHQTGDSMERLVPPAASLAGLTVDAVDAVIAAARVLGENTDGLKDRLSFLDGRVVGAGFAVGEIPATKKYYAKESGELELVWDLSIRLVDDWYNVFVSAMSGEILGANSWANDLMPRYRAVPLFKRSVLDGTNVAVNSNDGWGWHYATAAGAEYQTDGQLAYVTSDGKPVVSRDGGVFDFSYDTTQDPSASLEAQVINVFTVIGAYHDLLYAYGFNEGAGNFQYFNRDQGGVGEDPVMAEVVNLSGTNNARFLAPPDGQPGVMSLYVWTRSTPRRAGAMDNTLLVHELTHGLTSRLTGGPMNANCLRTPEARGLAEGWSDAVAWWMMMEPGMTRDADHFIGAYAVNVDAGVRPHPYSTDLSRNPLMHSDLTTMSTAAASHDMGVVWGTMLYEVFWNMVERAGYSSNIYNVADGAGNVQFLRNLVDGLKIQGCNPTFLQARDAFLQADRNNNGGAFGCVIWRGFAKRGLGVDATSARNNGMRVPKGC
ncbi:Fungalysin/Thermolysin Extracellular metalloproteinase 5 [Dinochytrium kinnereticum]|nr:Fungalysin/Thermolysin Extracellular metalloproteinase 5 [Dinochytrium kinnereticum]